MIIRMVFAFRFQVDALSRLSWIISKCSGGQISGVSAPYENMARWFVNNVPAPEVNYCIIFNRVQNFACIFKGGTLPRCIT